MSNAELCYRGVGELGALLRRREISPVELLEAYLERCRELEPTLNSFITLLPEQALQEARRAEEEIRAGRWRGPLHGLPYAIKDLFAAQGVRCTLGSKAFDRSVSEEDSGLVARLRQAGAILLGKANLNPLAYGAIAKEGDYDYGHMHNPWDPASVSGGSSGGSGSAAAAGECAFAIGSDTGGSVRIPSCLCGIVGLKPTYGRLSRRGLSTLSWSLDSAGPMTRSVEDCALVMNAAAGFDPRDPSSARQPVPDYTESLEAGVKGLRIGVPRQYFEVPVDPQVRALVEKALETLGELGASVREVSWPLYHYYESISTPILLAEGAAAYRRLVSEQGDKLNPPLRLRLEAGLFVSAPDYLQAQQARLLFNRQSRELLEQVDLLAGPTTPITATKIGVTDVDIGGRLMGVIAAHTQYLSAFNLNGLPALTVPCGFAGGLAGGLPVGLQLAGRPFEEAALLRAARAYERTTEWHLRKPPL
jgi:aspartyl-tRNA(Asn)/glutamyl-tRNA(Gln) amidotransferase subunit A